MATATVSLERHVESFTWNFEQNSDYPLSRLEQFEVVVLQCTNLLETLTEQRVAKVLVGSGPLFEVLKKDCPLKIFLESSLKPNTLKIVMENLKFGILEINNLPSHLEKRYV